MRGRFDHDARTGLTACFGGFQYRSNRQLRGQKAVAGIVKQIAAAGDAVCRQGSVGPLHNGDGAFTAVVRIDIGLAGWKAGIAPDPLRGNIFLIQNIQYKSRVRVVSDLADQRHVPSQLRGAYRLVGAFSAKCCGGLRDLHRLAGLWEAVNIKGGVYVDAAHGQNLLAAQGGRYADAVLGVQDVFDAEGKRGLCRCLFFAEVDQLAADVTAKFPVRDPHTGNRRVGERSPDSVAQADQ